MFPADNCTDRLKKNFFVDNLIKTGNSVEMLSDLYTTANYRMEKGHFNVRSRNTNCEELKTLMIKDQKFVENGCQLENVLGYKYSTLEDTLQISGSPIDLSVNTKRGILAQTARVFDPLSLCLPVTIRGKMLLRDLWSQKLDWDDIVWKEFQNLWFALSCDLAKLDSLQFLRFVISEDGLADFYIFCDASKGA